MKKEQWTVVIDAVGKSLSGSILLVMTLKTLVKFLIRAKGFYDAEGKELHYRT